LGNLTIKQGCNRLRLIANELCISVHLAWRSNRRWALQRSRHEQIKNNE